MRNSVKNNNANYELCDFFESYNNNGVTAEMPQGVYSLDDVKELVTTTATAIIIITLTKTKANPYANITTTNPHYHQTHRQQ